MTISNVEIHADDPGASAIKPEEDLQAATVPFTNAHKQDAVEEDVAITPTNDLPSGLLDQAIPSTWEKPGPAAFDFRSDVVTRPTGAMLAAISITTLEDDVFQEDPTTMALEALIAELTGKEAGLLVSSGTMSNQVAIRTHLQGPPHSVVCDVRSHLYCCETGGVAALCGALTIPVQPSNGRYLTLEDVQKSTIISNDVVSCPTKLISLENTLGGMIMPLAECQRISAWARKNKIILHLDGARLWEAVAAGAGSLRDYSDCFDSVNLCFSKGLGAPIGSIAVGTHAFRERARWIRKSIGGGLRQSGVISAAARVAVQDTFPEKLQASHASAKQVARMWEALGGHLSNPVETNMVWLDLATVHVTLDKLIAVGAEFGLRFMTERLVIHYQICDEALAKLEQVMRTLLGLPVA